MKRNFWLRQLPLAVLASGLLIAAAAWQSGPVRQDQPAQDTLPEKKKIRDIDQALEELEKSRLEMEKSLKDVDFEKIHREIQESMKKIDMSHMQQDIDKAMKEFNSEKIREQVARAMKEFDAAKLQIDLQNELASVDSKKIKEQIEKAMKELDAEKIQANVEAAMAKIDMEKIKQEMERVKNVDMKKLELELKDMGPKIEKSMEEARKDIEKAKKELLEYRNFIQALEKDGLLNTKEPYTIEYKVGELRINGKKQGAEVVKKYNDFLGSRSDFTIKKDRDDFNFQNQ